MTSADHSVQKSEGLAERWNHWHGDPIADFYLNARRVLRKQRMYLGLRQKDVADLIGITLRMVKYIETGHRKPKFMTAVRFCHALGLKIHDLGVPWTLAGDGFPATTPRKIVPPAIRKKMRERAAAEAEIQGSRPQTPASAKRTRATPP